jgi:TrpR family trp operon transcriptional repressor
MMSGQLDRLDDVAAALAGLDDPVLIEEFLRSILTESEASRVSARWELSRHLLDGRSQRTIAQALGVSLCNITRGSRELQRAGSPLRRVIEAFESGSTGHRPAAAPGPRECEP